MQSRVVSVSAQPGTASEDPLQPDISLILDTWPNPFAASLNINLDTRFAQPRVRIYNLRGARIRDLEVSTDGANCVWDGNLESGQPAPAGIYLLRAETGKNSELRRVVKTR
jgi:flagellar hook assembly protein FlgD